MLKFGIMLYFVPNITYVKFGTSIALEDDFVCFVLNYSIDIWI